MAPLNWSWVMAILRIDWRLIYSRYTSSGTGIAPKYSDWARASNALDLPESGS
jgi:hypothetical protein